MRVGFVSHVANYYGAAQSLATLVSSLSDKGVDAAVVVPAKGELYRRLSEIGVRASAIGFRHWATEAGGAIRTALRTASHVPYSLLVARRMHQWGVDVVHTNSIVTPVGYAAARLLGVPHVWHIREFGREDYGLTFNLGREFACSVVRNSDATVCISRTIRDHYRACVRTDRSHVIYNPVAADDCAGIEEDKSGRASQRPTICVVGRIRPEKGFQDAIRALGVLRDQGIEARLLVAGDGRSEYVHALQTVAADAGVAESTEFLGYRSDVLQLIASSDILAMCSKSEAFGRVTAEAMLVGTPVVGAKGGATPELLQEGDRGLLYDPGDEEMLASQIRRLLRNDDLRGRLIRQARQWVRQECDPEHHAEKMLKVFRYVVGTS